MQLPWYYETRPPMELDPATIASFDRLFAEQVEHGTGAEIAYTLAAPKWKFLSYLSDTKDIVVHGSGSPNIEEFEPRQSNDIEEFGNRQAVYAASDALWAMYFAIVDRPGPVTSLTNACFRVQQDDGTWSEPYYFFSINDDALPHDPWRNGTIYLLPRAPFEQQSPQDYQGKPVEIAQWASLVPVKPLAKVAVAPEDFPFLSRVRGHNVDVIRQRAALDPGGFPWMADPAPPADSA